MRRFEPRIARPLLLVGAIGFGQQGQAVALAVGRDVAGATAETGRRSAAAGAAG